MNTLALLLAYWLGFTSAILILALLLGFKLLGILKKLMDEL